MKKVLYIVLAALTFTMFEGSSSAQTSRNDVVISWDQLSADASLRQFKKASKQNQIEILHNLVAKANEEFYRCKEIGDLDVLNDQMDLIRFYYGQAKMQSTTINGQINSLQRKIDRVVQRYTGQGVVKIEGGIRNPYVNNGQDITE